MEKFLNEKLMPFAGRLASQKHLLALRDGLILSMPIMIIGSMFIIFNEFPSEAYQTFMVGIFGAKWSGFVWTSVYPATMAIVSLLASFGVANYLAKSYGHDGLPAAVISLSSFLLLTTVTPEWAWSVGSFDATGLFTAMLVALFVAEVYRIFLDKKITIKLPDSVPPNVSNQFTALIPGAVLITFFLIVKVSLANTEFGDVKALIFTFIQTPLKNVGTSVGGFMIFEMVAQLLWTIGIHGHNVINSIAQAPLMAASLENLENFRKGIEPLNIITDDFKTFIYIGGAGATLPLAFMMTFLAKSKQVKQIGKLSILPGIFNINEPITFGLPIILNPFMIIPFMITPIVLILVSYFGIASGIFPKMVGITAPWTTPKVLLGYIGSNGNIMGSLLVLVNFVIAGIIYYPFFSIWDKKKLQEESVSEQ